MSKKEEYEKHTEEYMLPIVEKRGFELYDVEFVKEGNDYYLRAYIEKPGGITINDCVDVSREMNEILDKEDYIKEAYIFEVSSPGLDRPLKKDKDFERNLGKQVDIKTYKAFDKQKEFTGVLSAYDKDSVTVTFEDGDFTFLRKDISLIRLTIDF
ncbi:MAG: ribosome maturation factor RimP [Lachnospiraceae bacterium]|nr:ribosome maturation factor RimP [Lachnospiraceae bacterium]